MSAWLTLVGWLGAGVRRLRGTSKAEREPVALDLDHCAEGTRDPGTAALSEKAEREVAATIRRRMAGIITSLSEPLSEKGEREVTAELHRRQAVGFAISMARAALITAPTLRILRGPEIDGATAWSMSPPEDGWPIYAELSRLIKTGARTVDLTDTWGEVVTLGLEQGAARGEVVIMTSRVRIGIRKRRAEVQITADAAETEGVELWYLREMPRAAFWLLGVDIGEFKPFTVGASDDRPIVAADCTSRMAGSLALLGVSTRRIEICCDVEGFEITAEVEDEMVTRASTHKYQRTPGDPDGVACGHTSTTKNSLEIYNKLRELARRRGPARAALEQQWGEHGDVTRVELRLHGDALVLEAGGEVIVDARHPGAPLDRELLGKLWDDGLSRHRRVEPAAAAEWMRRHRAWKASGGEGPEPRLRDCPEWPGWTKIREAGGSESGVRYTRAAAGAQLDAVRDHHRARFAAEAAHVEVLAGGDGEGDEARAELEEALANEHRWSELRGAARARHQQLLEDLKGREQ